MGRRRITNYAAVKDVQTKPNVEECAEDMGPRGSERGSVPEEVTILCQEIVEV